MHVFRFSRVAFPLGSAGGRHARPSYSCVRAHRALVCKKQEKEGDEYNSSQHRLSLMNGVVIFFCLGIGVDHVFVFADAWAQANAPTTEQRLVLT